MKQTELKKIELAVQTILETVGEDIKRPGLKETPARVARMYAEIFASVKQTEFTDYKMFKTDSENDLVIVKEIPFYSMCEHHLLPFWGTVSVGYVPKAGQIIGLSKIARLVDYVAKRPSVQERLTSQIVTELDKILRPGGIAVEVKARHMCMEMRGIQKTGSETVTAAFSGGLKNAVAKSEFQQRLAL
ncbi:GTP cyclohydrolase I FolE [Loigolactobacillus backii]|uniref:GTP cyclohydrolase 1 n=1 Tax=Loigolactobacillus backii TaxID=375175 RepID=A0A192H1F0_9LACO|nr:GTP cyclohydrolase I FolE [Loigolactobacillus backii]ANK59217.1 GTP cyclohydrolase I [Loigolactobacillus backii]ANK62629.1 GTP cyclohydrolase I [Loigolactobacillus backii]ANK64207.1 GTP cyclohydrolase I [Loigolactobacillus backii]ANK67398.1 GTP cyclohydrolase I [Loigolactobacillus backii]ANK70363.1 GTP cyclohydrolase I [Loigolactobacillus backii]